MARMGVWFDSEIASMTKPVTILKPRILSVTVNSYIRGHSQMTSAVRGREGVADF